jgi:hypothetical protein
MSPNESKFLFFFMFAVDKTVNRIGDSCSANQLRVRMIIDHKILEEIIHGLDRRTGYIA